MIYATTYPRTELKSPYKSVRHIVVCNTKEDAERTCKILNVSIYKPIGLTSDEIDTLYREGRSKFFIGKVADRYEVVERLCYEN